jgi:hypothetical protein
MNNLRLPTVFVTYVVEDNTDKNIDRNPEEV